MAATQNESQILVQSLMRRGPLKLIATDTVESALRCMVSNHLSSLPVVDEKDCLVGIVSLHDLMAVSESRGAGEVSAVMTEAPVTIGSDDTIREAARLMTLQQVHHLPVVNTDRQLVGVISSVDFVRLTADGVLRSVS